MSAPGLLVLDDGIFAEEVADLARDAGLRVAGLRVAGLRVAGFVENLDRSRAGRELLGLPVHWVGDVARLGRRHDRLRVTDHGSATAARARSRRP